MGEAMIMKRTGRALLAAVGAALLAAPARAQEGGELERLDREVDVLRRELRVLRDRLQAVERRRAEADRSGAPASATPERDGGVAPARSATPARADGPGLPFRLPAIHSVAPFAPSDPVDAAAAIVEAVRASRPGRAPSVAHIAFDLDGSFIVPPELWRKVRPAGAPLAPRLDELQAALGALVGLLEGRVRGDVPVTVEDPDGSGDLPRVRLAFLTATGEPCPAVAQLVRCSGGHFLASLHVPGVEALARRFLAGLRPTYEALSPRPGAGTFLADPTMTGGLAAACPWASREDPGSGARWRLPLYGVRVTGVAGRPYDLRAVAVPEVPGYPVLVVGPEDGEAGPTEPYDVTAGRYAPRVRDEADAAPGPRVTKHAFVLPGVRVGADAGGATPEEVARRLLEVLRRESGSPVQPRWKDPIRPRHENLWQGWTTLMAFDQAAGFVIPAELWAAARPAGAPAAPSRDELVATTCALWTIAGRDTTLSHLVVEGGEAPVRRVLFSFAPELGGAPCEVGLLLVRVNGRWLLADLRAGWFEARARAYLEALGRLRAKALTAIELERAFPEAGDPAGARAELPLYRVELQPAAAAVPVVRWCPTLALVEPVAGDPPGPGAVRVVVPAADGQAAPLDAPGWFRQLPHDRRPPLPLPEGVTVGEREGEYVNAKDGSILVWVREEVGPGRSPERAESWFLGKYEVTWGQYRDFCKESGRPPPPAPEHLYDERHPVAGLVWEEASAYCAWAGLRLPTRAEWEYTARGPGGFVWPWGDEARSKPNDWAIWGAHSRWGGKGTAPAGSAPDDRSPFGALDLTGNVREWLADRTRDGQAALVAGGSYDTPWERCRVDLFDHCALGFRDRRVGLRVAR